MHKCGTRYEGEISKMWVFPQRSSKSEFLRISSVLDQSKAPLRGVKGDDDNNESCQESGEE